MSAEVARDGNTVASKAARQGAITELLAQEGISSQEQLRAALSSLGIETAQATLSRDLLEMQATKVRRADGLLVYTVPNWDGSPTHQTEGAASRLARWCQELLIGGDIAQNQLVLRTPVGAANLLGSAIDSARIDGVIGTIAGDDTVLLICCDEESALSAYQKLLQLAEPGTNPKS